MPTSRGPGGGDDWIAITDAPLPVAEALAWAVVPRCGAVVTFTGTVRDHADVGPEDEVHAAAGQAGDGRRRRDGVTALEYEAYEQPAQERLAALAVEARRRWPGIGRTALLHRVGRLGLGEAAVVVAVSAPHRDEAFAAAWWAIDTLKATVPIWKREEWAGGRDWGTGGLPVDEIRPPEDRRAGPRAAPAPRRSRPGVENPHRRPDRTQPA